MRATCHLALVGMGGPTGDSQIPAGDSGIDCRRGCSLERSEMVFLTGFKRQQGVETSMSTTRRRVARDALALLAALTLAAAAYPWPSLAAGVTIRIVESFDPPEVTVAPGTTITWVNESGDRHRVRTTSGPAEFDSGDLEAGQQFSVTLSAVGVYEYLDDRDKEDSAFWARIIVAEQAPSPSPTPTTPVDPGATTPPAPPPSAVTVSMAGEVFRPSTVTLAPGGSIAWRNDDDRAHTVSATNDAFDSGILSPGQAYSRTFPTAGTYPYLCLIHPKMTGTVVVAAPGTTPPPPAPTPVPTPSPAPTPVTPPAPGSIRAVDFAFQPTSLAVVAGSRVSFVNAGKAPHTMTARDGSFDSGIVNAGGTWVHAFSAPGTYAFLCSLHPQMVGTLRVADGSGTVPPPAPTPVPTPPPPKPVGTSAFEIQDFSFQPASIRVAAGSTVRWVNVGLAPHTVTDRAGTFDSGTIDAGESWSTTFEQPGTFAFWCVIHPDMTGVIEITATGSAAGAAAGSPSPTVTSPVSPPPVASAGAIAEDGDGDPGTGATIDSSSGDTAGAPNAAGLVSDTSPVGVALSIVLVGGAVAMYMRVINGVIRRAEFIEVDAGPDPDRAPNVDSVRTEWRPASSPTRH